MKNCLYCTNIFVPGRNTKGKFCSTHCAQLHNADERVTSGKATEVGLKHYLLRHFGAKCMTCGWKKVNPITQKVPVQLNHRDGNSKNNKLNNGELLCPNCHSLTPTFGALNKGKGRRKR